MKTGYEYWSRALIRRGFFMLITLQALSTMAPLFLIIRRGPFAEGAWPLTYFPVLASILPWFTACLSWWRVNKRVKLGVADRESAGFCYSIIILTTGTAYA
ncbi:MAG TPA: hypothetical protein VMB47_10335, partial [Candidatus Aquilonibacter sp.]|nr:hypothetical protein [Candidatus Aquilonibacter sp.]